MKKTVAFIGLELRSLKPYKYSVFILLGLALIMGYFFHSAETLTSYLVMMLLLMMSYPFAIGEKNRLDTLYATLSIGRRTVVNGRYGLALLGEVLCAALALLLSWLMSLFADINFQFDRILLLSGALTGVFSLLVAAQFPIYFKFGYNRAKLLAMLPLAAVFLLIIELPMLSDLFGFSFSWNVLAQRMGTAIPAWWYIAPFAVGLVLLWLSSLLSCRLYASREL